MPLGTTAAILLGIGAAGAAVGVSALANRGQQAPSAPLPLPTPPSQDTAQAAGNAVGNARRASATQTVYTGPLGLQDQANITKKVLLGQ